MAKDRLSMRKIKEVLRLHFEQGLRPQAIAESIGAGKATVWRLLRRAKGAGISWPVPEEVPETELESRLYRQSAVARGPRVRPDLDYIHRELRRKGVTLRLLWDEYRLAHPSDGYAYSQYCKIYRRRWKDLGVLPYDGGLKEHPAWFAEALRVCDYAHASVMAEARSG